MFRVRDLTRSFLAAIQVRVKLGDAEPATEAWYRVQLKKLDNAAGDFPAASLRAEHLVSVEFTNAFVRVLKAVYRWACDEDEGGLLAKDPFKKLKPPPCGQRERILTRAELCRLYLASSRRLRRLLFVMVRTLARPGEIRALQWGDIAWERQLIVLKKFKGRKRRKDGVKIRTIPMDRSVLRLMKSMYERRGRPDLDQPVWLDRHDKEWSPNGVRCQMRGARKRAGLDPKGVDEKVVCYTMRHTGATRAARNGVRGKMLSDIMGHSRSSTTDRYQHLAGDDLVEAIELVAVKPRPRRSS